VLSRGWFVDFLPGSPQDPNKLKFTRFYMSFATGHLSPFVASRIFRLYMTGRVLVLNASFEPINVCNERRAVVMIFKGVARVEEHNGHMLHSARLTIHAPSVIRLTEYIHIPFERRSLSRKNILLRDHSTCQYCGRQYPPSELTLDHVLPRSRGGESAWDNLVACCKKCNHRKGNRTPDESGMHLLRRPRGFSLHVNRQIMRYLGRADETWRKYLFYESNNGE
jgi:5-methylcytosine-specific restriction endonuclease McrA